MRDFILVYRTLNEVLNGEEDTMTAKRLNLLFIVFMVGLIYWHLHSAFRISRVFMFQTMRLQEHLCQHIYYMMHSMEISQFYRSNSSTIYHLRFMHCLEIRECPFRSYGKNCIQNIRFLQMLYGYVLQYAFFLVYQY
ncbi:unnamed protein product [Vicia faba]|uniref:Uncharacterized protein n=1 Tax=Vicia faba TaxID=3906 RepID=A0AAV0ZV24_VICFA|nr:unnamed protein product [Vicia faba]